MGVWRLLGLETCDAFMNMAVDEAVLQARIEGKAPNTVRFFRWNPSAVSIGRFQDIWREVYVRNCEKHGVDVVRRITGGGAVYHDRKGEITYSVVAKKEDLGSGDVAVIYRKICSGIIAAVKILGVDAEFNVGDFKQCPNITVSGRKISGSAQSYKKDSVLQHGTLLLDVNLEKMFTFLRVPWAKTCMEVVSIAERKITSLRHELKKEVSEEKVYHALVEGFENSLGIQLVEGELSSYECRLAETLRREKYLTHRWNFEGKRQ